MAWCLSTIGKMFCIGAVGYAAGAAVAQATTQPVSWSPEQCDRLRQAILSSERFRYWINQPGATAESVLEYIGFSSMSPADFERVLGVAWPL